MQPNPMQRVERAGGNRRWERWGIILAGALVLMVTASGSASPTPGALTQLADPDGCVAETATGATADCADGKALDGASGVAVSKDGKHVYVASQFSDAVAVFSRDKITGKLTQLADPDGCVSETGTGGECANGKALDRPRSVAVSKDGKHVYVASATSDAVAVFSRNKTTGVLTQLADPDGCVSETGTGGECANGVALDGANSVVVNSDGKHVYVTSSILGSGGVAAFARNKTTGALTQLAGTDGCVSETGSGGACADGVAVNNACSVAVSPDRKHVYVGSCMSDAVAIFARNKTTGALTQLAGTDGCVSEDGTGGECANGKALDGAFSLAVSKDGKHVYVASFDSDAVAVFSREK